MKPRRIYCLITPGTDDKIVSCVIAWDSKLPPTIEDYDGVYKKTNKRTVGGYPIYIKE